MSTDEWQASARRARQLLGLAETALNESELSREEVFAQIVQDNSVFAQAITDLFRAQEAVVLPSASEVFGQEGYHFRGCAWETAGRCTCAEVLAAAAGPVDLDVLHASPLSTGIDMLHSDLSSLIGMPPAPAEPDDPAVRLLTEGEEVPEPPKKLTLAQATRKIAQLERDLATANELYRLRDGQVQSLTARAGRGDRCEETLRDVLRLFQPDTAGFLKSVYISLADYNAWCELVRLPRRDDNNAA